MYMFTVVGIIHRGDNWSRVSSTVVLSLQRCFSQEMCGLLVLVHPHLRKLETLCPRRTGVTIIRNYMY